MLYRQILAEGGSAIDAMIAMSLSLGVTRIVSSGIGGGGLLNYYKRYIITLNVGNLFYLYSPIIATRGEGTTPVV